MDSVWKLVASEGVPLLLMVIGFVGIPREKRKGALRVVLLIWAVILVCTMIYLPIMIVMTPRWVAKDCEAAFAEISAGPHASEPALAHDAFMTGCNQLSMSAAGCTVPSFAAKFPESCVRYVDEIHAQLPQLVLPTPPSHP